MPFPINKIQPFTKMVQLVTLNPTSNPLNFTPALMLAIFWEETMFQNMKQWEGGPGVGFGQIEKSSIPLANLFVSGNPNSPFNAQLILNDDNVSVQASTALLNRYIANHTTKNGTLMAYSGNKQAIVNKWLKCETALNSLLINPLGLNPSNVENALQLARVFPKSGPEYNIIHQQLF